jgi:GNAT superfamily N-acetyltransferase
MYTEAKDPARIEIVAHLAREIWTDLFGDMVDSRILADIIRTTQSKAAVSRQIAEGCRYFLIEPETAPVGYFAFKPLAGGAELFLSKLYIRASERGKGLGRGVIQHLEGVCSTLSAKRISLTVFEKNTKAVRAFQNMGFSVTGTIDRDLGDGIVSNDYRMEKTTSSIRAFSLKN